MKTNNQRWMVEFEGKSDFDICMGRGNVWDNQKIIDRAPIHFSAHNAAYSDSLTLTRYSI